ncbi:FecR family protein [Novosphingobium guangzhouense]|nr:FecR domain-containing protein [Novosphingobium guangzhouense]
MSALDREAVDLLVRLDDRPDDDALHAQVAQWQERSPAHRASWGRALDLAAAVEAALPLALTGTHPDHIATLPASRKVTLLSGGRRWQGGLVRRRRVVAAVAAAACLGLVLLPNVALRLQARDITGTGEVRQVVLEDGTRVALGPDSALAFDVNDRQRSAHLLRGRAFFDVAHDKDRPFRVLADDTVVTVLGTAFEVDDISAKASVAVRRGTVAVKYGPAGTMVLHKGDVATRGPDGHARRGSVRADRIAGWIDGRMFVKDRPVGEVLEDLRPWYRGYILARGPGLASRRVTGIYDLRNPDAALAAIAKVHPLRVTRLTPWVKIVSVE